MEAVVDQTFGNIHLADAGLFFQRTNIQNAFVRHAVVAAGIQNRIRILQTGGDIVGVEDRHLAGLLQAFRAHHARAAFFHRAGVRQRADFPGAAHHRQLFGRFKQPQVVQPRPPVGHGGRRLEVLAEAFAQLIQRGVEDLVRIGVFALRVVHHIQTVKQQMQLLMITPHPIRRLTGRIIRGSHY